MNLAEIIDTIPSDRPVSVLMRHAEREALNAVQDTVSAPLNAAGVVAARDLGGRLARFGTIRLFYSPVPRCEQTARLIAEGAGEAGAQAAIGGMLETLGGPYMQDWQAVMAQVLDVGARAFTRDWFAGKVPAGLTHAPGPAAREQLQVLVGQLQAAAVPALTINVSHDWNVLLVRRFFLDLDAPEGGWPDFMEGVAASLLDDALSLQQGRRQKTIPLPLPIPAG